MRLPEFSTSECQRLDPVRPADTSGFRFLFSAIALMAVVFLVGLALLCGSLG